ncbi:2-dehydropantoate 2-reductase [Rhodopirellula maiorica SM1]|uniref:2-dehydropantoate 2-reductase n=1 Tax=Rhodopirellula maiorica SM1 TaxID=1265738 RepID=M5RV61_9BACT|nr:putative 2-dehydropantoate 2-reductase [Rhodopirellula maiorica]EMI17824.1 2-dehydropantoate 2-reductase [Rhodopirellula maiorica SM1]
MNTQRYAIIGAGALGGLYGAMLARQGFEVHFLLHSDFDHVRAYGLKVDSIWGDMHLRDIHVHASTETMPPCGVSLIGLKTTQNHLLAELLPAPTRDGGVVLVLQNGLNVEADSAAIVGEDRVFGGCCFLCSNKVGPGHIRHIDFGKIVFGQYRGVSSTGSAAAGSSAGQTDAKMDSIGHQICDDLNAAGVPTEFSDNLALVRWRKLMWNIPFNSLSVILNASTKQIMDDPNASALAEAVIREVRAGAAACGVEIPEAVIEKTLENTRKMVPYDSSMRLDFLNKRAMEAEAILGNPLRAAKESGYEMSRVETLYHQLRYIDHTNS